MKDSVITLSKLDHMRESGVLCQELGCFLLALPCFQNCGCFLDLRSGQSKAILGYYFPKWKDLLKSAVESGFYLKAVGGEEIYFEVRFFADNKNTNHYWRSAELNLFADGLFINAELIISNSKANGGPLSEFLELWEKAFYFNDFGKGTLRRKNEQKEKITPQDTKTLWRARIIGNGNSNGNKESGIDNGELGIKESGIEESLIDNQGLRIGNNESLIEESVIDNEPNKENISSSNSSHFTNLGNFPIEEDQLEFPSDKPQRASNPIIEDAFSFQHDWKMAKQQQNERKKEALVNAFEGFSKEKKDACRKLLSEDDQREIESYLDELPF